MAAGKEGIALSDHFFKRNPEVDSANRLDEAERSQSLPFRHSKTRPSSGLFLSSSAGKTSGKGGMKTAAKLRQRA
jgi:hypothetical protein